MYVYAVEDCSDCERMRALGQRRVWSVCREQFIRLIYPNDSASSSSSSRTDGSNRAALSTQLDSLTTQEGISAVVVVVVFGVGFAWIDAFSCSSSVDCCDTVSLRATMTWCCCTIVYFVRACIVSNIVTLHASCGAVGSVL